MRVGYFPCTQDPPQGENIAQVVREAIVEAQTAEDNGYDSVLFSEHHQQEDGYIPNTIMLAAMVGMQTRRINVGSCVLLLPLCHPVRIAEDCAIVDRMTGGRMILGVGVGYQEHDFSTYGIPVSERIGRSEEGLEIIKRCWTERAFSFRGEFFKLNIENVTPKPARKPRPPIWMGACSVPGVRRAARIADAWLTSPLEHLEVIKRFAEVYRDEARRRDTQPFVVLMRDVVISESWEMARRESEPIMYTHRFYFRNGAYPMDSVIRRLNSEEQWTFDVAASDRFIAGSPSNCLDQLRVWQREVQPDYLVLRMRFPGGPAHERVREAIVAFGHEVIPRL